MLTTYSFQSKYGWYHQILIGGTLPVLWLEVKNVRH
jgi:hypothetical protein